MAPHDIFLRIFIGKKNLVRFNGALVHLFMSRRASERLREGEEADLLAPRPTEYGQTLGQTEERAARLFAPE